MSWESLHSGNLSRTSSNDMMPVCIEYADSSNRFRWIGSFFVHGTHGKRKHLIHKAKNLIHNIENTFGHSGGLPYETNVFSWSGANNTGARLKAAEKLAGQILENHIPGEPITIFGHSHGGNLALETAEILSNNSSLDGVDINVVTLNTSSIEGGTQLSAEGNKRVKHYHIYAINDLVAPKAGFNESGGPLYSGGERTTLFGKPKGGEFSYRDPDQGESFGRASRTFPTADANISYTDGLLGRVW